MFIVFAEHANYHNQIIVRGLNVTATSVCWNDWKTLNCKENFHSQIPHVLWTMSINLKEDITLVTIFTSATLHD